MVLSTGSSGQALEQPVWNFSGPMAEAGTWDMRVTASSRAFMPGDGLTLGIDFTIHSLGLAYNIDRTIGIYTLVTGKRIFDVDGNMTGGSHAMDSTILTGVGLPIDGEYTGIPTDRFGGDFHHPIDSFLLVSPVELEVNLEEGTLRGTAIHGIMLDQNIPPGWYQLRIDLGVQILEGDLVSMWGVDPSLETTTDDQQTFAVTCPLAIGTTSQPRLIWTLFSSNLENGGAIAAEDKGYVALSRGRGYSSTTILPMRDNSGGQARYLLEPDFPLLWNPFMRSPGPSLDLDFQSGWLEVRIENPDGSIVDLGGAAFAGRRGMGATTLDGRFEYSFSSYGLHLIELTGWIKDSSNQVYTGGGVYEVYIAKPLDIETNVIPGTPFRINDYFDPGFQLYPPVPARVDISWKLDRYSRRTLDRENFEARANRWGYYSPPIPAGRGRVSRATIVQFTDPGEYSVTFSASYREPDGTLWMGEKILTGIVYPNETTELSSRPPASGSFSITNNARYFPAPSDSGDTLRISAPAQSNLPTVYTFPTGFFTGADSGYRTDDAALVEMEGVGAGVFVAPRLATSTGLFPHYYPENIDRRAYLISTAVRNDQTCQVHIGDGSAVSHLPYPVFPWLPGELPVDSDGDIYHFWSGMVYRDMTDASTRYGYYSSGATMSESLATSRIHVEGSPLITDGWGERVSVMHNLAVKPGSILSEGTPFTAGAYFLPLPNSSTMEFILTPPEGSQQTIIVTADDRGYGVNMRDRFNLDGVGVWRVESVLMQDDETGGPLGVNIGDPWEFYVINDGNNTPINFHLPVEAPVDLTDELLVLTGDLIEGDIAEGTVYISTTFNGAVVEQTLRTIQNSAFIYSMDIHAIRHSLANYDPADPDDKLVFSFYASGLTSTGSRRIAARMIFLQDGILYTGEKDYSGIDPLTRDERMRVLQEMAEAQLAIELRGRTPATGDEPAEPEEPVEPGVPEVPAEDIE